LELKKTCVFQNLNFSCKQGEIIGITGANGSGKSVLFKLIAGLYKKDLNRVENLEYNEEENRLFRKDRLELEFLYYGKDKKTIYFRNPETEKKVRYNYEFRKLSKESKDNIESEFGKQLRMNRSIQVEGAFAVIKEDMKLRKLKVRGKNSVKREIALFCIAYNFNRYISKLSKNKIGTVLHSLKSA